MDEIKLTPEELQLIASLRNKANAVNLLEQKEELKEYLGTWLDQLLFSAQISTSVDTRIEDLMIDKISNFMSALREYVEAREQLRGNTNGK